MAIINGFPEEMRGPVLDTLARREPGLVPFLTQEEDFCWEVRRALANTLIAEAVSLMGPDFEATPEHLFMESVVHHLIATWPIDNYPRALSGDAPCGGET
jgi:hypothetical protein